MRRLPKPRRVPLLKPSWALAALAPWALGMGVLVSFTADAGQDFSGDANIAPLTARSRDARASGIGMPTGFAAAAAGDFGATPRRNLIEARLIVGAPEETRPDPEDENEPRVEIKPNTRIFPEVDRSHKSDPLIAIRPSLETRKGAPASAPVETTAAAPKPVEPPSTTQKTEAAAALPAEVAVIATSPRDAAPTTMPTAMPTAMPTVAPATEAAPAPDLAERALHGASPSVSRAVALGSTTPAEPDAMPIEVTEFPGATLALAYPVDGARPDYAALLDPSRLDREKRCLAEAVYFESRSEPEEGQAAVAQVVLNRVQSGLYPASVCGVVYQNRTHYKACQFSFACEGRSLRITEQASWTTAVRVATEVMEGRTYISDVGRSTHYHTNYVRPRWARALTKMDVIGRHIFYRLKPGQT
jgi:spore germination cell wall hydrolase CwlJ-like protein